MMLNATWLRMTYDFFYVWTDKESDLWKEYMEKDTENLVGYTTLREHLARRIDGERYKELGLTNLKKKRAFVDSCVGDAQKTNKLLNMMWTRDRDRVLTQLQDIMLATSAGCTNAAIRHILYPRYRSVSRFEDEIRRCEARDSIQDKLSKYMITSHRE